MIGLFRRFLGLAAIPEAPELGDQLQAGPIGGEISGRICELIGDYDPHHLTHRRMMQMRLDADVAFGTAMVRAPIINRNVTVEGEDPEVVAYAESQLNLQYRRFAKTLTNAQPMGYKVAEIVWKTGPYSFPSKSKDGKVTTWKTLPNAWTWDRVKSINGETLTLLADEISGEFQGVKQTGAGDGKDRVCGPVQLALWSFRKEDVDDHLRGYPLLDGAYSHWWSKHANRISRDTFLKRDASPLPILRAVTDQVKDEKGASRDGYAHMRRVGNARQAGAFVVLPSKKDDKGNYLFDIQYLESGGQAGDLYQQVCDKEGIQILRSFGITDEVGTSQDTGSRSRSQTHQETFLETLEGWNDDYVDDTMLPKLKENCTFNYGPERVEKANLKIRAAGISAGLKDTLVEVLGKVMDGEATIMGGGKILTRNRIDAAGICKSLNIPLLPEDEVEPDPPADPAPAPGDPNKPITPEEEAAAAAELRKRGAMGGND